MSEQDEHNQHNWSPMLALQYQREMKFIPVGLLSEEREKISLKDAREIWNMHRYQNVIFHTGYRIVGNPYDVQKALSGQVEPDVIDQVIETSIDIDNYEVPY